MVFYVFWVIIIYLDLTYFDIIVKTEDQRLTFSTRGKWKWICLTLIQKLRGKNNTRRLTRIVGICLLTFVLLNSAAPLMNRDLFFSSNNGKNVSVSTQASNPVADAKTADYALTLVWNSTWGGTSGDYGYSVWADGKFIYTCGYTPGNQGFLDLALVKWDENGGLIWSRTWGGCKHDYGKGVWGDGTYIYTCGSTESFPQGESSFVLIKWDAEGNILWNRTWCEHRYEVAKSVWGDGTNLYTCGYECGGRAGGWDLVLVKWDTNGNPVWNRTWGGAHDESGTGIWGEGSSLYICGATWSYGMGSHDFVILQWDTSGNLLWTQTWGTRYVDSSYSLIGVGPYLYIFGESTVFDYPSDFALVKMDKNGNYISHTLWGNSGYLRGGSIWSDGRYLYSCGTIRTAIGPWDLQIALMKWDLEGNIVETQMWGNKGWDEGFSIWGVGSSLYVCGYSDNPTASNRDFVLVKWDTGQSIPILNNTSALLAEIAKATEIIWASPEDAWRSPAAQHMQAMVNKLEDLRSQIQAGNNSVTYESLLHDIKPKLTALTTDENEVIWGNGIFKNPWVIDTGLQEEFQAWANNLLARLLAIPDSAI